MLTAIEMPGPDGASECIWDGDPSEANRRANSPNPDFVGLHWDFEHIDF